MVAPFSVVVNPLILGRACVVRFARFVQCQKFGHVAVRRKVTAIAIHVVSQGAEQKLVARKYYQVYVLPNIGDVPIFLGSM